MSSFSAQELDFDTVLKLVAAHAQTRVGRLFVTRAAHEANRRAAAGHALDTRELSELIEDGNRIALSGVDDAVEWLNPASPMPTEPADLLVLIALARRIAAVRRRLLSAPEHLGALRNRGEELPDTAELVAWAAPKLGRDGKVPDDASPELSRLRRKIGRTRNHLLGELEAVRRSHKGIVTDAPPTLRRDRYCLPVNASARSQMKGLVLDSSGSGATTYMEPFTIVEFNNDLAEATAGERDEIRRILNEIATAFMSVRADLADAFEILGQIDAIQARVLFGRRVEGQMIEPGIGEQLILYGARHPLLDERLHELRRQVLGEAEGRSSAHSVTPLDFRLPDETQTLVISGPNAGGKTVVLKTLGLMVLMCYNGIPLPVSEGSTVPWFEHLWCRIGDDQDVSADLSTFSGAMSATAQLLEEAGPRSLVIYDELGAGTDPLEGAALGCALLEELTNRGCRTVATTHLAAIAMSAAASKAMENAAMEFDEDHNRPTYTLRMGRPGRSRGLEIASTMGVFPGVIEHARDLLGGQHLELERWLERLENLETEVLREKEEAAREHRRSMAERRRAEMEQEKFEKLRDALPGELEKERDRLRQRAKKRLDRALQELEAATKDREHLGKRARQRVREKALDLRSESETTPEGNTPTALEPGLSVRLNSLGSVGVLQQTRGSQAKVAVQGKSLWVSVTDLEVVKKAGPAQKMDGVHVDVDEGPPQELILLGLDGEEAREQVERYLDRAHAGGVGFVRIVHGHGTGTLRRIVSEILRSHPAVGSFAHPPQNRGGTGATEVTLES
ncbi:MAG: Smr/MutS family protein [Thermoanaerobaculales bacterium]|nr:Smr/MutS family protein [Thermoanaerobaculales bacterium]